MRSSNKKDELGFGFEVKIFSEFLIEEVCWGITTAIFSA